MVFDFEGREQGGSAQRKSSRPMVSRQKKTRRRVTKKAVISGMHKRRNKRAA